MILVDWDYWDGLRKLITWLCRDVSVGQIVINIYTGDSCVNLSDVMVFRVPLCL